MHLLMVSRQHRLIIGFRYRYFCRVPIDGGCGCDDDDDDDDDEVSVTQHLSVTISKHYLFQLIDNTADMVKMW